MWRWTACLVAACLAHDAALTGYGQDRPVVPLPDQCSGIRFELVMGRITAIHLNAGQFRLQREPTADWDACEILHVNSEGPIPLVRYECRTSGQRTMVEITNGTQVLVERTAADGTPEMSLRQNAKGPVVVTCASRSGPRTVEAPTFWHLLLSERRICEQEVIPVLQLLRPSWNFAESADQLEKALYECAHASQVVSRSHLSALVHDLGHRDFQRRQRADQQLRALGPVVLPYFATLRTATLTKEQRHRIRQIQQAMATAAVDSPNRVAEWLVDDEQIWVVLLNHHDAEKRHLAALRLTEIHPAAANFDPYGDELYRQQQLDQLRLVLLPK